MRGLQLKKYSIVYADPPWHYGGATQHRGKGKPNSGGAESHYPLLTLDKLQSLDLRKVCEEDCLLFLWTSSPHLDQAIALMQSWGFSWATVGFIWHKQATNPGYYTMSECELCLIGKRGRIPTPRGARNVRQFLTEKRTTHSTKPEEVRRRIEAMFPTQRKLEMFARKKTVGWDVWGNEVASDIMIGER